MIEIQQLIKKVDRLQTRLDALVDKKNQQHWVKVSIIQELTGWNGKRLDKMRNNGIVKFREKNGGKEYLLESIPQVFLKQSA